MKLYHCTVCKHTGPEVGYQHNAVSFECPNMCMHENGRDSVLCEYLPDEDSAWNTSIDNHEDVMSYFYRFLATQEIPILKPIEGKVATLSPETMAEIARFNALERDFLND